MSRRKKPVEVNGRQDLEAGPEAEANGVAAATLEPPAPAPSVEERLAALESQLAAAQQLVNRQAATIVQAAENAQALKASRLKVAKLEAAMDTAKRAASNAKKAYETAVEEHFALEEELNSGQQRLPFGEPEKLPEAKPAPLAIEAAPDPDQSWRSVSIDLLDVSQAIRTKLHDAGLSTIGALSDYTKPGPSGFTKRLTDIERIGEVAAEKIAQALDAFWADRAAAEAPVDVDAELAAGCREVEEARGEPESNGEWQDSEPGTDDDLADDDSDDEEADE